MRSFGGLKDAIARLKRLRNSGGSRLVHDGQFRRAVETLEVVERGGLVGRRDLLRAIAVIVRTIEEQLKRKGDDETR